MSYGAEGWGGGGGGRERKRKSIQVARSHTACCPPVPELLGTDEKEAKIEATKGVGYTAGTLENGPQGIAGDTLHPLQGKGIGHPTSTALCPVSLVAISLTRQIQDQKNI